MKTKVAAVVFYVDESNEDIARKQIETIIDIIKHNPIFHDVELDQKYADRDDLLFNPI